MSLYACLQALQHTRLLHIRPLYDGSQIAVLLNGRRRHLYSDEIKERLKELRKQ